MGKRELVALLNLSSWCLVVVERLFLAMLQGCLRFVIVVFPDHTHLLFLYKITTKMKTHRDLHWANKKYPLCIYIFIQYEWDCRAEVPNYDDYLSQECFHLSIQMLHSVAFYLSHTAGQTIHTGFPVKTRLTWTEIQCNSKIPIFDPSDNVWYSHAILHFSFERWPNESEEALENPPV